MIIILFVIIKMGIYHHLPTVLANYVIDRRKQSKFEFKTQRNIITNMIESFWQNTVIYRLSSFTVVTY